MKIRKSHVEKTTILKYLENNYQVGSMISARIIKPLGTSIYEIKLASDGQITVAAKIHCRRKHLSFDLLGNFQIVNISSALDTLELKPISFS